MPSGSKKNSMSFTVMVKQEAHEDALAAYDYYEEKQPGLGERFPYVVVYAVHNTYKHPRGKFRRV